MSDRDDELRAGLDSLRESVLALDMRLAALVAHRESSGGGRGAGGRISHSPAPWNASVALCRMDLHSLARELERSWRLAAGLPVRSRGGSDANTAAALRTLERLCRADGVTDADVREGRRRLARWQRAAGRLLGDLERPRRIPVPAGGSEPGCPGCGMRTLRMLIMSGSIRCVNPSCDIGAAATISYSETSGLVLTWMQTAASEGSAPDA